MQGRFTGVQHDTHLSQNLISHLQLWW